MKRLKMLLIIALVLVTGLFGYTKISARLAGVEEGPKISCPSGQLVISVSDGEDVLLQGVSASDAQDGDLTDRILVASISQLITEDTATVTYLVFDSDDNMARAQRTVRYSDYNMPTFTVLRPLIFSSENVTGITNMIRATDVVDGNISDRVRMSNLWVTDRANVYSLTVLVTNSMGDTAKVSLPVIVEEAIVGRPVITLSRQLIYLDKGDEFDPGDYLSHVKVNDERHSISNVEVEHEVNTSEPGTYWVYYTCMVNGIQGTAILTVVVQ